MAAILICGGSLPQLYSLPFNRLSQKSQWVSLRPSTQSLNLRTAKTLCSSTSGNQPYEKRSEPKLQILRRWDVPWDWQTISLSSLACGLSISVMAVLGVLYTLTKSSKTLPDEIYRYDWREPFNLQRGWLLWAAIGFVGAVCAFGLVGVAMCFFCDKPLQRRTDVLALLLPMIGSSTISTARVLGIAGILSPVFEETVFRGFLMVSLTKWLPTPLAIALSAAAFSAAHRIPAQFPQVFVLGTALGLAYAQTRNLLTPITIHACWNCVIILLLAFLRLQGIDLKDFMQLS